MLKAISIIVFTAALAGCSATVTTGTPGSAPGPSSGRGPDVGSPLATPPTKSDDGKIDLNGHWVGYGTADPSHFWSVNFDFKDHSPVSGSTKCKVELQIIQKPDYLRFVSAEITFPDSPQLGYFDAKLVDSLTFQQGQAATNFDRSEYQLAETQAGSGEYSLTQLARNGTLESPVSGAILSYKQHKLTVSSSGPYTGAYRNDNGEAYTSSRDFAFSWSNGTVTLDSLSFWDYGASVAHATDAECDGAVLSKDDSAIVDSDPPGAPAQPVAPITPPAPVIKPQPAPTVPVKTIECATHVSQFKYVVPQAVFDLASKIPAGTDQVAKEQDIQVTSYLYAEANSSMFQPSFAQLELADVTPLTVKAYHWNRTDNKEFRLTIEQDGKLEFELYSSGAFSSFWSDSRFRVGKIYDYASTDGTDTGVTCLVR